MNHSRLSLWTALSLLAFLLTSCGREDSEQPSAEKETKEPSAKVKAKLGERTIATLVNATRVEVFRLDPKEGKPRIGADSPKVLGSPIGQWLVTSTEPEQGREFAARLVDTLFEDETHFGGQMDCFFPGVAFRLWHEEDSVHVIICFRCENLYMVARHATSGKVYSGFSAFGGSKQSYGLLVKLAKEALPDDAGIQTLGETSQMAK